MTIAELLRNHADLATREGGMYYSGEYLSRIAKTAESLEAENAKLRELVEDMLSCIQIRAAFGRPPTEDMYEMFYKRARELGVDE